MTRGHCWVLCTFLVAACARDHRPAVPAHEASRVSSGASGTEPGEPPPPPGKFRIRLSRASRVGERVRMQRTVTDLDTKRVTRDGKITKDETTRARLHFDAESETLSVDKAGIPRDTRYRIKRFTAERAGKDEDIIQPGTTLLVKRGIDTDGKVESSTGTLNETELWAIKLVVSVRASRADDQQIFGTNEPRAPGESWPMNVPRMAEQLKDAGLVVDPSALRGSTTLVSEKTVGGERCLEIVTRVSADPARLSDLPPNARLQSSRMKAHYGGCYPIDPKLPVLSDALSMNMNFRLEMSDEKGPFSLEIDNLRERESSYTPL